MRFRYPMLDLKPFAACLLSFAALAASAQVAEPSVAKAGRYTSIEASFVGLAFINPAAKFLKQRESFTQLSLNYDLAYSDSPRIMQLGKGGNKFGFDAETFTVLDEKSAVWGKAYYKNGSNKDVVWNETSDFLLLYPYVMGDERGGKLDYEEYFLDGGYTARHGRFVYGGSLSYRARSEYRTRDPRPKNVVADLMARIGFGMRFGKNIVSVAANAGKYKQTNELSFFNELGASKEYHLTGLGTDFARFSGANNNVFYKGTNFGGSLEFLPDSRKGISASVKYNHFFFEKILSDLNRLPLNKLHENAVDAEVAFTAKSYGLKLNAGYKARRGNNNMFGDAAGNIYPQIGSLRMFESDIMSAKLSGYYSHGFSSNVALSVMPFAGISSVSMQHELSGNNVDINRFTGGADITLSYIKKRSLIQLKAGAEFAKGLSESSTLSQSEMASPELYSNLNRTLDYLNGNALDTHVGLRYDYALRNLTLFAEARWLYGKYLTTEKENRYEFKIGVTL